MVAKQSPNLCRLSLRHHRYTLHAKPNVTQWHPHLLADTSIKISSKETGGQTEHTTPDC